MRSRWNCDIRASHIEKLFCVSGTVTRKSKVRSKLIKRHSECRARGADFPGGLQNCQYTEPAVCLSRSCNNHSQFELGVRLSTRDPAESAHSEKSDRRAEREEITDNRAILIQSPAPVPETRVIP
jgi:hypothetical protein